MRVEDVIDKYVKIRDKRRALKEEFENSDAVLKNASDKIEAWLLKKLSDDGLESTKTPFGTAYISKRTHATCNDWTSFWGFISRAGRFDFLEKRPASRAIAEYFEECNELPPGLDLHTERVVNVRRA